ncbi:MAG: sigma-54-dependent Fis family transcriptional regulator, partial [Candidatus Handelsmanbacteria bacterium]|nr:sigma-54-dependent Fis family transcriptional regulator [Candidatus Handelsmanbacteria bacterium]
NLPTVLVYGKPGSGKELVARAIHARSGREGKFIAVNCAAIPKDLFESELFGHSAGAFTGATGSRAGIFEEAQNGTVFLDEINKMPVDQQGKLLRVLENKEARRVGTSGNYPVNALVVTATNEDLQEKAHDNKFLQDLYSRLLQPALVVPPLRYRTEDTPLLVNHILQQRFPGTPLDQYRFPLALFCEGYLTEYSSVRDLINLIETVVTRVGTPVESDPCYSKLLQAVATAERTGRPPFSRAKLAGIMNMARSNLSTQPWKTAVDRLVDEGKIESRV